MTAGALFGVTVVELGQGVAAPYAGKLLADLSAEVIKVEPPDGDRSRRLGPFPDDRPDPERSGLFLFLNTNKRGTTLNLSQSADRRQLLGLIEHADILLDDLLPAEKEGLGLDHHALLRRNPGLVAVSTTPFGQRGPKSRWETSEFTQWAQGGYHYIAGEPGRPPLALPGYQAEFHGGVQSAIAALAALWHVRQGGRGQSVDVSHQEAILSAHAWLSTLWFQQGKVQERTGSPYVRCSDGFVYLFDLMPYHPNLWLLVDRPDMVERDEYAVPATWWQEFPTIREIFAQWARNRRKDDIYHAAQELRIAATPVCDTGDLFVSAQLASRQWFQTLEHPVVGRRSYPGVPYRLSRTPAAFHRPAPTLGQDNQEVLSDRFQFASDSCPRRSGDPGTPRDGALPLEGLRVLEMTANWAGPLACRHLADLGAEVIKVELARKPATRALIYPHDEMWVYHYNRSGYFNKMNRNKRDVCLDISTEAGRQAFLRLIECSDVFLENHAVRVTRNLGIDYEVLSALNPRLVMCSISGMGQTGPEAEYLAYGSNIEPLCGLSSLLGYDQSTFYGSGSYYADPVSAAHATVAVLAALLERRRSGRGQFVDVCMLESTLPFLAEAVMDYALNNRVQKPRGNRSPRYAPQGAYRSVGQDSWLAVTCRDDEEWGRLARTISRDDLASDPRLASVEGRLQHHDEIDMALSAWSEQRDHNEAIRILQSAGVAAAPVAANWEITADPHLHERGFFVPVTHPEVGTYLYPGFPWKFSETQPRVRRPAPAFAQDNDYVFRELLGLSAGEETRLYETRATSREAEYAAGPGI